MSDKSTTEVKKLQHRHFKRNIEMKLIVNHIRSGRFACGQSESGTPLKVLEFGCGDGFQLDYLQELGKVTAIDIDKRLDVSQEGKIEFVNCSIDRTPFHNNTFDIIFSNHVIEHLENPELAFDELLRIGKPDCLYAFAVPTVLWLLLSIPAQYVNKFRATKTNQTPIQATLSKNQSNCKHNKSFKHYWNQCLKTIFPLGHGVKEQFLPCLNSFRKKKWIDMFGASGFRVRSSHPLLVYGPSEFPVVPTTRTFNRFGIASSILFILDKGDLKSAL